MSGIKTDGHNKFVSCQDCPDRCIDPNCHNTCRGYMFRAEEREKIIARKRKERDYFNFKKDAIHVSKKRAGMEK